ncbi:MAG: UDP-glucose 4-epimerase GalE [Hyphomicrobiales bacterium]|nr:UDP-glucose 4-epimerase GalE [Hyphomicrobiales bacterium]
MTVLVTGGAGYIGGHMVLALRDAGEAVVVVDDLSTGFRWAVPSDVTFYQGDFGDQTLMQQVLTAHKVDAIAHFAAKIVVPESVADPLGYYRNNTSSARNLLEMAVRHAVPHMIFSSTAAVYGEPDVEAVSELEATNPMSPYGRSKLMVEWMLEDTARAHDFAYVALRYFNVAGADPQGRHGQSALNATHLIKRAVQTALGRYPYMEVFGTDFATPDGTGVRDYIQITDLIAAHMRALAYLRRGGQSLVCNCGYGHGASVLEVIAAVKKVSGVNFEVRLSPRRAGDPARLIARAERARERFGWVPQHDNLDDIVRQALDWERRLHNHQR